MAAGLAPMLLVLTAALAASGGPASHFSVLYLLPVAVAALVLGTRSGLLVLAASILSYGSLFVLDPPSAHGHDDHGGLANHIVGMWVATALVALAIAVLMGGMTAALRARQAALRALEERAERHAHLVALSTLAAGAAHELGSPLATIAVAAREIEHAAADACAAGLAADARLIRAQVTRCRSILDQMTAAAGGPPGEAPQRVPATEIVREALADLPAGQQERVDVAGTTGASVEAPLSAVAAALRSLLRNALDASPGGAPVELAVKTDSGRLRLEVRDRGEGMPPEVLARAGEPFFTTKPPGKGSGLGLFVARSVAEQLGGEILLESRPGAGTTATLALRTALASHEDPT